MLQKIPRRGSRRLSPSGPWLWSSTPLLLPQFTSKCFPSHHPSHQASSELPLKRTLSQAPAWFPLDGKTAFRPSGCSLWPCPAQLGSHSEDASSVPRTCSGSSKQRPPHLTQVLRPGPCQIEPQADTELPNPPLLLVHPFPSHFKSQQVSYQVAHYETQTHRQQLVKAVFTKTVFAGFCKQTAPVCNY